MTEDIEKEEEMALAAEYTLGLLSPAEAKAFEDLLAVDPSFRADYAFWAQSLSQMTDDIAPVNPPSNMAARIDAALFGVPAKRSWLDRLGLLPYVGGGLAAAAVVLFAVNMLVTAPEVTPLYTAEIAAEDASLVLQAAYLPDTQTLRIDRATGAAREGRVLELWLIAGDNPPVSLGVLPDAQSVDIVIDANLVAGLAGGLLAISDEPPGGSTTGAPTGDVLAVGPVQTL